MTEQLFKTMQEWVFVTCQLTQFCSVAVKPWTIKAKGESRIVYSDVKSMKWKYNMLNQLWTPNQILIHRNGRAVTLDSLRPVATEPRVRARVGQYGNSGGQSGSWTGFSPGSSVFPVNFIPPTLSILTYHLEVNNK
jgi:hypothetical protein